MRYRNGEAWWNIRKAVQSCMMHPTAALVYLPVQNAVADDLIRLIGLHLDGRAGEVDDFMNIISRYTMEGASYGVET